MQRQCGAERREAGVGGIGHVVGSRAAVRVEVRKADLHAVEGRGRLRPEGDAAVLAGVVRHLVAVPAVAVGRTRPPVGAHRGAPHAEPHALDVQRAAWRAGRIAFVDADVEAVRSTGQRTSRCRRRTCTSRPGGHRPATTSCPCRSSRSGRPPRDSSRAYPCHRRRRGCPRRSTCNQQRPDPPTARARKRDRIRVSFRLPSLEGAAHRQQHEQADGGVEVRVPALRRSSRSPADRRSRLGSGGRAPAATRRCMNAEYCVVPIAPAAAVPIAEPELTAALLVSMPLSGCRCRTRGRHRSTPCPRRTRLILSRYVFAAAVPFQQ